MAAEHETPESLYFKMTSAVLWRNELKIEHGEDNGKTKSRLFAILGWLGRANLGNPFVASGDLASYLKFSVSKYVINYGSSIFINYNRFPFGRHTANEWFDLRPKGKWPERGQTVKAIYLDIDGYTTQCYRTQNEVAFPDSLEDAEFEVFSHGTSHNSAVKIIKDKIDLGQGKEKKDFSTKDGFYLNKHFDKALHWAQIKYENTPAVLVFRLKKTELRGDNNENGCDLRDSAAEVEWREVIKQCRRGELTSDLSSKIEHYKFIEGPIAARPFSSNPVPIDNSHQLCVREESCAKLFDYSLHSVIFLYTTV